jgi:hypothetical protein
MSQTISLGQTVTDQITGFSGVVTGRCEYITGCHQVLVQPRVNEKGDYVEARWIDEDRLDAQAVDIVSLRRVVNPGFDKEAPKR